MADIKISQLTAKAAKVESTDRIPIADFNGTTYDTKYVTGAQINELSLDTSPQLGGNLDVNGHTITSDSDQDVIINPNGTGITKIESDLHLRDSAGATAKEVLFYEGFSNGTNYVALKAADSLTANTTYTLPTADGTSGQVLQTNGTGTLSWTNNDSGLTVNSTAITSGTAGRVFFQNASNQLSQSSNLFWDNSNNRLGINTATPTVALDVTGVIQSSGIIRGGVFTAGTGLQATDFVATSGRVRAANGISFRPPTANDNTSIGVFPDGSSGSAGVDIFSAGNKTINFTWCGNTAGNAYSFTQNYTTTVSTGTINTLNITPTINANVANTITYRGIYYNPTITNLNGGTHIGLQTTTGSVIFNSTSGNVAIGGTSFGTSSDKVLAQYTGTAPGSSPADAYQMYSADATTNNAAPHFRTENGNVVKLYQQSSAGITTVSDLVTILQNLGLLS
jgi:hypothetical protein